MNSVKYQNRNYCCAPQCSSRAYLNKNLSFHRFPSNKRRRTLWIYALKIGKPVTNRMVVCSAHFCLSDYILPGVPTKRRHLKKNAIPSKNLPEYLNDSRTRFTDGKRETKVKNDRYDNLTSAKCNMLLRCCARRCNETYNKNSNVSLHVFPKDPVRRKAWSIRARGRSFHPSSYSMICSKHFTKDCFERVKSGEQFLKPTADPTIFYSSRQLSQQREKIEQPSFSMMDAKTGNYNSDECTQIPSIPSSRETTIAQVTTQPYNRTFSDNSVYSAVNPPKIAIRVVGKKTDQTFLLQLTKEPLKKVSLSLAEVLDELKQKDLITEQAKNMLKLALPDVEALTNRGTLNAEKKKKECSAELRNFALSLYFYSEKAYNYILNNFNTYLPDPSILHLSHKTNDVKPELTSESFTPLEVDQIR